MADSKHRVLVVGGGFGGLKAVQELSGNEHFSITLLSDRDDFRYYPTIYHTAIGGMPRQSSIPLSQLLPKDVTFVLGTADRLDRASKTVHTKEGASYPYDTLILSLGSVTSYFGLPGVEQHTYGIKTTEDALKFKNHLHEQLTENGKPDDHYVIIGAGATGIELAGELVHYLHKIMKKHGVEGTALQIDIIDTSPTILPRASAAASRAVTRQIKRLGIVIHAGQMVKEVTAEAVITDKETIPTRTAVWTAGMSNNSFYAANSLKLDERKKVIVDEYLQSEPDVYVLGDSANTPYAGLAQTAIYDAHLVAHNLELRQQGKEPQKYALKKPPTVFVAGRGWAAVDWGKVQLSGTLGWFMRQAADILGFHDYTPWVPAVSQWATEFGHHETCPVCSDKKPAIAA